uniref:Uncharacterized protein n=1 Tax=Cajanus cajan TaxID=3821 RepID=A0A151U4P8_CAJCA|nr:hypothetical protein KK1_006971 [Cajanus cajan]
MQTLPLLTTNATVYNMKDGDDNFVPIPGMEEASLKIFQSQVLLPFTLVDGSTHAFLGPFMGQNKKKFGNTLLPEDSSTLPFIHSSKIDLSLFGDTAKIFRAFPPTKDRHLQWLLRVENAMSSSWVETGIFEFIQLAKFDLHLFDPQMLISAISSKQSSLEYDTRFRRDVVWVFIPGCDMSSMRQKDVRIYPYQPQLFARQFGLCQMKPLPLRRKDNIDADICVERGNYEEVLDFILRPDKQLYLTPCSFSPSFLVSKCFLCWWCEYYVDKIVDFDEFFKKLINSPLSSQGPKQSGTFKNQTIIYQFEQFFKVCYRPDNIGRIIFDASVSLSKMVQRNIRLKKVINPRGKTDFEKFCPKNIPPLPNALFGVVKHLSRPPWVKTLDPLYFERKEVPVKNRVTYARCSLYDFPRRRWWPLCWVDNTNPPPGKYS